MKHATRLFPLLTVLAVACGDEIAVAPHVLDLAPGCFVEAPPRAPGASTEVDEQFAQMLLAMRQMHEFQASFAFQGYQTAALMMQRDPTATLWHRGGQFARSSSGLTAVASGGPSGASLGIPGTAAGAHRSSMTITMTAQTEDAGSFTIRWEQGFCTEVIDGARSCDSDIMEGAGLYSPPVTRMRLGGTTASWNDDYVRIESAMTKEVMLNRGCDPETMISFERALEFDENGNGTMVPYCWDQTGANVSCDEVGFMLELR